MVIAKSVIEWLMNGDPVIRWQTMRDLTEQPPEPWEKVRRQSIDTGWGALFLARIQPDGQWPEGRWTATTWTLLTLIDGGIPPDHLPLREAAGAFLDRNLTREHAHGENGLLKRMDLCHLGFWLRIGSYFLGADERLRSLARTILSTQMEDGGWNCRQRTYPKTRHSSFHTTFNVLEGLSAAAEAGVIAAGDLRRSQSRALEFMLAHQMYRSDRTGQIVHERFTHLTFPSHWHYTVLRGLDYMRNLPEISDPRLDDPVALLESRRRPNGRWPVEKRIPGSTLFEMEQMGGDSRWNTLRALRVLQRRTCG